MYNGIASLKNNVAVPEVVKQSYHMSQQFPQRNKSIYAHENLYMDGHSGIIHNRPKVEAKCLPIDEWINKMWYIFSNIQQLKEYDAGIKRNEVATHPIT